jgi:hypothetical protein
VTLLDAPGFADLDDPLPAEERQRLAELSGYRWDERRQRYVKDDGDDLSEETLLLLLLLLLLGAERSLVRLSGLMLRGEIPLGEWQDRFAGTLRPLHLLAYLLGVGGIHAATAEDYAAASTRLREQLEYLNRFAQQVETRHPQANSDTDVLRRARMYANAARRTYEAARQSSHARLAQQAAVLIQEQRVLGNSEHCPDCLVQAGLGWQPLGTLLPIGVGTICKWLCRCHKIFRIVTVRRGPF